MDLGVWMSSEVLAHKQGDEPGRVQFWNVGPLPDAVDRGRSLRRLFVAVRGQWRGFIVLSGQVLFSAQNSARPYTLIFDPRTWTPIAPQPAPPRTHGPGYTLQAPIFRPRRRLSAPTYHAVIAIISQTPARAPRGATRCRRHPPT